MVKSPCQMSRNSTYVKQTWMVVEVKDALYDWNHLPVTVKTLCNVPGCYTDNKMFILDNHN